MRASQSNSRKLEKLLKKTDCSILVHLRISKRNPDTGKDKIFFHRKKATGLKIVPKNWDFLQKKVKPQVAYASEFNEELSEMESRIFKAVRSLLKSEQTVHENEILDVFHQAVSNETFELETKDFFGYYQDFLVEKKLLVKESTYKKYGTLEKDLKAFEEFSGKALSFKMIDREFGIKYYDYLTSHRGLVNNTSAKYIETFKVFMRYACANKAHDNTDFELFNTKRESAEIIVLTKKELKLFIDHKVDKGTPDEFVKDFFLFAVETGQRFSDLMNLTEAELREGDDGVMIWNLNQRKGNKDYSVAIPLTKVALHIIEKYKSQALLRSTIFPNYTNNHVNRILHNLAEEAGIDQMIEKVSYSGKKPIREQFKKSALISMHVARKTFITQGLMAGLSPEYIRTISGHVDHKAMKPYIKICLQDRNEKFLNIYDNDDRLKKYDLS